MQNIANRFGGGGVSDANIVGEGKPKSNKLLYIIIFLLFCFSFWFSLELSGLKEENILLKEQIDKLVTENVELKSLSAKDIRLRQDLDREIARKNTLAVENTNLKGRIKQAEEDLRIALSKLKEKEGVTNNKKPMKKK